MKKFINRVFVPFVALSLLVSCTDDLVTSPDGSILTEEQKQEVAALIPERLSADLNGMYAILGTQYPALPASERADDFGYASVTLAWDHNASDMVSPDAGYNWFATPLEFSDRTYTYASPYIRWALFYKQIKLANDLLAAIPEDSDSEMLDYYRGQALAVRAFDYFNLVQMYQFTYKGNEDKPSIPIITNEMEGDPTNNPRATVQAVYDLILSDLDQAIELLEGFSRPNKAAVNQAVAYGIRARVHLVMQNWENAASDAADARAEFEFLSKEDAGKPGFNDASAANWMWAVLINPVNISSNYNTWPSKLSSFAGNSYTANVGQYKSISSLLWAKIPATDVRKGWWVDESLNSPILEDLSWPGHEGEPIGPLNITDVKMPFLPYTNVKFGPTDNVFGNGDNSADWVIMRSEEMLLIEAEALAMSGDVGAAATLLETFMKDYRDPSYTVSASSAEQFQIEVWKQRRIELWGEGFSFFDILRLQKNIVRFNSSTTSNFPIAMRFNMAYNDPWLLLRIPQREINSNMGISETDNNSGGAQPVSGEGAGLSDPVTD